MSFAQGINTRFALNATCVESLDRLIKETRPDVIDICTPGATHAALVETALNAGCHVLVEKPPVRDPALACELAAIAKRRNLKLAAVFNYRYRDLVLDLKRVYREGTLGEIVKVAITHHGPLVHADVRWLWNESESKYLLWEYGIHFLDILVDLLGPHASVSHVLPTVQKSIGHVTDLDVMIDFANGSRGRLEITADTTRHSSALTRIDVYGTAMDAFVRWFPPSMRVRSGVDNPLKLLWDESLSVWSIASKILKGEFIAQRNISHVRVINGFAEWIRDGGDFDLAFERIVPTLRLLAAIEEQIPSYQLRSVITG